jgi:photosystem II stability/assembly factor-like uncharacterized protein
MSDVQISRVGAWEGGTVVDLASYGDTVLAATFAGVFRSTDRGQSWQPVGRNLPDWFIQAVALAPVGERLVGLAASHLGWLYRSMDGGLTWETASDWRGLGVITRLVASPSFNSDGIVFACTEDDGIFKSSDRGITWKQASFGLLNLSVTSLRFSPAFDQDEVAFAGTDGGGLFRSRNAGRAWRESGEGLPDSAVQCLAVSPHFSEDGTVWAGTEECGLYRSTDGGRTWSLSGEALAEMCVNGVYAPPGWARGERLILAADGGLLTSVDGGMSWEAVQGGGEYPYIVIPCADELLTGSYQEGVHRSTDGAVWSASNAGLAAHIPPMAALSERFEQDNTLLVASMEGALARSKDAGQTWQPLLQEDEFVLASLRGAGAGASMTLLAAAETSLLCSQDSGETWRAVLEVEEDLFGAAALSHTFAGDKTALAGTAGGQVYLSNDGGVSWKLAAALAGETIVALTARTIRGTLEAYAVTAQPTPEGAWQVTLRSVLSGAKGLREGTSWEALLSRASNEPVAMLYGRGEKGLLCAIGQQILYLEQGELVSEYMLDGPAPVSCFASAGETLLAGTRLGVYRSTGNAATWDCLSEEVGALAIHCASPDQAYALSMGGNLWRLDLG